MDEVQLWSNWQAGRLADGVAFIGTFLAIWLALRTARMTRENSETNIFTKVLSSAFGLLIVAGSWTTWTIGANTWAITAGALDALEEKTEVAKGFIEYVGTTEPVQSPTPLGIAFLAVVTIMILSLIWAPKQN